MQPFTFDQAVIAGLLFFLGILIGMFFLAGGKWKRRYTHEATRVRDLEAENEQLRRDAREMESLRRAAATAPPAGAHADAATGLPPGGAYRQNTPTTDGPSEIVIRRP